MRARLRNRTATVVRVRPLPATARLPESLRHAGTLVVFRLEMARSSDAGETVAGPARWHVLLGPGGDDAAPVGVDVSRGLLIAGPPGSGRTTALAVVGHGLARAGHPVLLLTSGVASPVLDGIPTATPSEAAALPDAVTLLVDDLDDLEREHPELVATLSGRMVATSTAHAAAGAYRGALPGLLRGRRVLVLDVHDAASAELVGPRSRWLADPGRRTVGRGALVVGREVTPVQVYDPG